MTKVATLLATLFALLSAFHVLGLACGCAGSPPTLTDADRKLGGEVGLADEQLLAIKGLGSNLRQLEGMTDEGEVRLAAGVTIDVSPRKARDAVERLRSELGSGYLVFVSERGFGIGGQPDRVSILAGDDPFSMLRTMGTNGWNYDLGPDEVIARLREWDDRFGLEFQGVAFDWVEATFVRPPDDMMAFAREVYDFCPDVVDQGVETVEALAETMRSSNMLYLWWD